MTDIQMAQRAAARMIRHNDLCLIPVDRHVYDVFKGEGWGTRGRYRHYQGKWYHVDGTKLDRVEFPNIGKH